MSWKKLIIVISLLLISACAEKSSMDESTGGEAQVEQTLTRQRTNSIYRGRTLLIRR